MNEHDEDGDSILLTEDDRAHIVSEMAAYDVEVVGLGSNDLSTIRELCRRNRHLADELKAGRRLPLVEHCGRYDFEVVPRASAQGGGWRLYLLDNGIEVGGGVFPVAPDAAAAHAWWDTLDREQRQHWYTKSASADPVKAHLAHLLEESWSEAMDAAGEWLDARPPEISV